MNSRKRETDSVKKVKMFKSMFLWYLSKEMPDTKVGPVVGHWGHHRLPYSNVFFVFFLHFDNNEVILCLLFNVIKYPFGYNTFFPVFHTVIIHSF